MTIYTLDETEPNEKSIHDRIGSIDIKFVVLERAVQGLHNHMMQRERFQEKAKIVKETHEGLVRMRLQLNHINGVIQDEKLQRNSKPLIIKKDG